MKMTDPIRYIAVVTPLPVKRVCAPCANTLRNFAFDGGATPRFTVYTSGHACDMCGALASPAKTIAAQSTARYRATVTASLPSTDATHRCRNRGCNIGHCPSNLMPTDD